MQASNRLKLKILFLTKSTPVYGGVERWLADLALGLEAVGYDCVVALSRGAVFHKPEAYCKAYPKLRTIELNGITGSPVGRQMAVNNALRLEQADIVVPVMLSDGLCISAYLKESLGYKLVYPVHEIGDGVVNDLRTYSQYIDSVVFVDRSSESYYQGFLAPQTHTTLVHCGVREAVFKRVEANKLRIGFCGRLAVQKRALDLIPLCAALNNLKLEYSLRIYGEGPDLEPLRSGLKTHIIHDSDGNDNITIHKPVDRDQLYKEFYNSIDILIITSDWETGPLVAFEAMINRVVVITSDFQGRSEAQSLIDGENCLVFPIGNMETAANQIMKISLEKKLKKRIADDGYEYASAHRRLTTMCEAWHEVFTSHSKRSLNIRQIESNFEVLPLESSLLRLKESLKKILGVKFLHQHAGEEWPYFTSSAKKKKP